jgi:multisubunit Na+/H+ antiporter MnhG subunit
MSTLKTVGFVILVIALVIVAFSLIGFVFSLVRILIEAAIIVGIGYVAYLFIRRDHRGKTKS